MSKFDLSWIATALGARGAKHAKRIQSLWSGYGELFRIELDGGPHRTAIVKWARPPSGTVVGAADASTTRKLRSFENEGAFYRTLAPRCDETCRVAALLASRANTADREWVLVLEDLDATGYPARAHESNSGQLDGVLAWLASFHARFLGERDPQFGAGTYWHLETRRNELPAILDAELRTAAPTLARRLSGAQYQTTIHGDAKDANFCFARDGKDLAAVDFQYTGRGCGVMDVAYLLYGRGDEPADGLDRPHLDAYFRHLRAALALRTDAVDVDAVEAEWRELYPVARLDFCRFLAGWRPSLWQADARGQRFVRASLRNALI